MVAETVVAPYNPVPELDQRVACVIVEPVAANMGLVATVGRIPWRDCAEPATPPGRC